jgi:hypothetical protein
MEYTDILKNDGLDNKKILDSIIRERKGQPVGNGYIDIIIKRENIDNFINDLTKHHFIINGVSWWFYCSEIGQKSEYGLGGPKSKYFTGWFSELYHDFDEIEIKQIMEDNKLNYTEIINNKFKEIIYNKQTIKYFDGNYLSFQKDIELTPGFWVYVPEEWKNEKTE